jgi:hypothetical protein
MLAAALGEVLHGRRNQRLARLEVMQVRAARDAGALGDLAGRRLRVAILDEACDRGVE